VIHAEVASTCPYDWGSPMDDVAEALFEDRIEGGNRLFDFVVAADSCIYVTHFHSLLLLDSAKLLMSKTVWRGCLLHSLVIQRMITVGVVLILRKKKDSMSVFWNLYNLLMLCLRE